jgi:hypothetical protein
VPGMPISIVPAFDPPDMCEPFWLTAVNVAASMGAFILDPPGDSMFRADWPLPYTRPGVCDSPRYRVLIRIVVDVLGAELGAEAEEHGASGGVEPAVAVLTASFVVVGTTGKSGA